MPPGRGWVAPALDHRASPPVAHADLTVCAWDTASTCRIERISGASALLALAPSTILQLGGAPDAALEGMAPRRPGAGVR